MSICNQCGEARATGQDGLCFDCARDQKLDLSRIERLKREGHPHHCACRQVRGDGECECDLYEKGYDPYVWMKHLDPLDGDEGYTSHNDILKGLARECPKCRTIDHYEVKGKKPVEVVCKCGHRFTVQKYKRGERPKAHSPKEIK